MYYRESVGFTEGKAFQDMKSVPKWAREERMERSVPLRELWRYSGSAGAKENNRSAGIIGKLRRFVKMKRKHVLFCQSAEEMNRRADALLEQGFQIERETGVLPVQAFCFPIFKIIFWK